MKSHQSQPKARVFTMEMINEKRASFLQRYPDVFASNDHYDFASPKPDKQVILFRVLLHGFAKRIDLYP